jgi:hypothetical protein
MSEAKIGKPSGMAGKKSSEETKAKLREAARIRKLNKKSKDPDN